MNKLCLDGEDWKLIYVKNDRFQKDGISTDIQVLRNRGYDEIAATVPGNLEIDLEKAGRIADPFYADNHYKRDCEYLHCFYIKNFVFSGETKNNDLVFCGLDTIADIYLNGICVGSADNMFIEHKMEVSKALHIGTNTLTVHIKPAVIEARKYTPTVWENAAKYNYESLHIRKASHMYSWDIMPRMVSAGIWKSVYLKERKNDCITEFYGYTLQADPEKNTAELHFMYDTVLSSDECMLYSLSISGKCGASTFSYTTSLHHSYGHISVKVENAKLWWPRFNGEQNIYEMNILLIKDNAILDEYNTQMGIRTVKLERSSTVNKEETASFVLLLTENLFSVWEQIGCRWMRYTQETYNVCRKYCLCLQILTAILFVCGAVMCMRTTRFINSAMKKELWYGRTLQWHARYIRRNRSFKISFTAKQSGL